MQCEFCQGPIEPKLEICLTCGREPSSAKADRSWRRTKTIMAVVGGFLAVLLGLSWYGSTRPQPTAMERITAACAKEYPDRPDQQADCKLTLAVAKIERADAEKMNRAAAAAGVR